MGLFQPESVSLLNVTKARGEVYHTGLRVVYIYEVQSDTGMEMRGSIKLVLLRYTS